MRFVNRSGRNVQIDGLDLNVAPGETCEIPEGYAKPRLGDNGARNPSTIELLAPQLVPADPDEYEEWRKVPDPSRPKAAKPKPRVEQLIEDGASHGVAEVKAEFEEAKASGEKLELTAVEAAALAPKRGRKAK